MKFSTLLNNVVQLIGGDSAEIDSATFRFVRDTATHRLRVWWDAAPWPETIDIVEGYVGDNLFNPPVLGGEDVIEAFNHDPRKNPKAQELDFFHDVDGIHFTSNHAECFVRVKQACPEFTGEPAAASATQAGGVQFYYNGDFWNGINGATASSIAQDEGNKVSLPNRAVNYLVRAIYADYLRSNNQHEESQAEEQSAEGVLNIELDRHYNRKGQTPKTRVKTYGN